jgi:tRNA (guanine-N7-)-methyltransferase
VDRALNAERTLVVESDLRIDPERVLGGLNWKDVFGADGAIEIEIGIGKGRFLLESAALRPNVLHFGVEWANKYLRVAESRATKRGLENVRFARMDARELVHRCVPSGSVSAYYVFYPDPWPKKRHHKRRFFRKDTVDHVARTLTTDGSLHVATDHSEYWETIEPLLDGHAALSRLTEFGGEGFPVPVDAPLTNYEAKYRIEGRRRHRGSWRRVQS